MRKIFLFILIASSLFAQVYPVVDKGIVFYESFENLSTIQANGGTITGTLSLGNGSGNQYGNFNGSTYIQYNKILSGTYSISCWVYLNNLSSDRMIVDFRAGTGYAYISSGGNLTTTTGTRYKNGVAGSTGFTTGQWYHIVISGITLKGSKITVGSGYTFGDKMNGYISNLSIFNRTLTASEVSLLYKQANNRELAITPSINLYVKDGVITEQMGRTITNTATTIKLEASKYYMWFPKGISNKIDLGTDFSSTGNVTIDFWCKPQSGRTANGRIFSNGKLIVYDSLGTIKITRNGSTLAKSAANAVTANKWYHVLITSTSAGVSNFSINGVASGTSNQSAGTPSAGTTNIVIGNLNANNLSYGGAISVLRVWTSILTSENDTQLYLYDKSFYGL